MENLEYKNEIRNTRKGSLGSSDGKMLMQIAELKTVPASARKRLAIVKGLAEQKEIPQTAAVRAGDKLEMLVYEHLKHANKNYQSNPLWVSKKYSRKNCRLITHPDLVLIDDKEKVIYVYEVKCTKFTFEQTRETYRGQLFIHWTVGNEIAKELGGYKVKLFLVCYNTEGLNLENGLELKPDRLTVKQLKMGRFSFDLALAMDIVDSFLENMTEYYEDGEEIPYEILPANVQNQFDSITTLLTEIKEREDKVVAFKSKLYDFLTEKNIKSIKNNDWSIVRIDPTESVQFDNKRYLEDFSIEHPRRYKKIRNKYDKVVKKKGYVSIKIKDKKS